MTMYELLSITLAAFGLLGGGAGWLLARSARQSASDSSENAARALTESAEALRRSAAASERANEIWDRVTTAPEPSVKLEVEATADRTLGLVRNVGELEARSLRVSGYPALVRNLVNSGPHDLAPRESVQFAIDERFTLPVRQVELVWVDDSSDRPQREVMWL